MDKKQEGSFSLGLRSLQLQLQTLLEEAGGEQAAVLLDALTQLSAEEQTIALKIFSAVVERISGGDERLASAGNAALKEFEESLYQDILAEFKHKGQKPQLEVITGGKRAGFGPPLKRTLIDLSKARVNRRVNDKTALN